MATAVADLYLGNTASHITPLPLYSPQQSSRDRVINTPLCQERCKLCNATGTGSVWAYIYAGLNFRGLQIFTSSSIFAVFIYAGPGSFILYYIYGLYICTNRTIRLIRMVLTVNVVFKATSTESKSLAKH